MKEYPISIKDGFLTNEHLEGKTVLLTGECSSVVVETTRSLLWLGARVVLAFHSQLEGKPLETKLNEQFDGERAKYLFLDIGNRSSIKSLMKHLNEINWKIDYWIHFSSHLLQQEFTKLDTEELDLTYRSHVRGPLIVIKELLPTFTKKLEGAMILVYQDMKDCERSLLKETQNEIMNRLAIEVRDKPIHTFIIQTKEDEQYLSKQDIGSGIAASVATSVNYRGLVISPIQALKDIGVEVISMSEAESKRREEQEYKSKMVKLFNQIIKNCKKQLEILDSRSYFEKQWLQMDFKSEMGENPEDLLIRMKGFKNKFIQDQLPKQELTVSLKSMHQYYKHLMELLKSYEKNRDQLLENLKIMHTWLIPLEEMQNMIKNK